MLYNAIKFLGKSIETVAILTAVLLVPICIVFVTAKYPDYIHRKYNIDLATGPSEFGDQYGALNALFSGLAFSGVIIAIFLQLKEVKYQRRELDQTQAIMEDQKSEMRLQSAVYKRQLFENTYFSLIDLMRSTRNDVRYGYMDFVVNGKRLQGIRNNPQISSGIPAFNLAIEGFHIFVAKSGAGGQIVDALGSECKFIKEKYAVFYVDYLGAGFAQYFSVIYSVIEFIENRVPEYSDSEEVENDFYSDMMLAQLSVPEIKLLFYHLNFVADSSVALGFFKRHGVFQRVPRSSFLSGDEVELFYCEED